MRMKGHFSLRDKTKSQPPSPPPPHSGMTMSNFSENTGNTRIVRTMPNTPATIQQGMTVWACSDDVSLSQRNSVAKFLSSLGEQHFVQNELYLDMATAVSGSGPGYVMLILEALVDAGT